MKEVPESVHADSITGRHETMTSRDFCYWLQGFFEIEKGTKATATGLTHSQVQCIRKHLAMVFLHEIDPSFPKEQKTKLDALHSGTGAPPPGTVYRC